MKTTIKTGLKVRANVKAGGFGSGNHTRGGLKVSTSLKAGFACVKNHSVRPFAIA
jgi:hypothetical protein